MRWHQITFIAFPPSASHLLPQRRLQGGVGAPPPLDAPSGCRVRLPRPPGQTVLPAAGVRAEPAGGHAHSTHHHPRPDARAPADAANPGRTRHAGAALSDAPRHADGEFKRKVSSLFVGKNTADVSQIVVYFGLMTESQQTNRRTHLLTHSLETIHSFSFFFTAEVKMRMRTWETVEENLHFKAPHVAFRDKQDLCSSVLTSRSSRYRNFSRRFSDSFKFFTFCFRLRFEKCLQTASSHFVVYNIQFYDFDKLIKHFGICYESETRVWKLSVKNITENLRSDFFPPVSLNATLKTADFMASVEWE